MVSFEHGEDFCCGAEASFIFVEDVRVAVDGGEREAFHLEGVDFAV